MNMRKAIQFLSLVAFCAFICVCGTSCRKDPDAKPYNKVFLMYSCGHNNLSSSLLGDVEDIAKTVTGGKYSKDMQVVVFSHRIQGGNFSIPVDPVLVHLYIKDKKVVRDTLVRYPSKTYAADGTPSVEGYTGSDPRTLREVLMYVKEKFPAKEYGFLFSSHGTGWLPYDYYNTGKITRSIGADYSGNPWSKGVACEIDVKDYARAFRDASMHVRYMLMDACFMGGVESAYELNDVCDYYMASQTEIWSDGLVYTNMLGNLRNPDMEKGLTTLCEEYMEHYRKRSQPATISVVKCPQLYSLASVCGNLFDKYRTAINTMNPSEPQVYLPTKSTTGWDKKTWFYDLEDVLLHAGIDGGEKEDLATALKSAVIFHDATEVLFDDSTLKHHCGLSMYLPSAGNSDLSGYYKAFLWNKDTSLVK